MEEKEGLLTGEEKKALLKLARRTIETYLREGRIPAYEPPSRGLLTQRGAFVTLHKDSRLRGCIGTFLSTRPLYQTVQEMAVAAATQDPRFPPLTLEELPEVEIEISVLSPLKRIEDVKEVEVGRHGLYIVKGLNRGVLLPQVATEQGWDRETFLAHTCLKAGLPPDAWKEGADIYTFTADVFSESDLGGATQGG